MIVEISYPQSVGDVLNTTPGPGWLTTHRQAPRAWTGACGRGGPYMGIQDLRSCKDERNSQSSKQLRKDKASENAGAWKDQFRCPSKRTCALDVYTVADLSRGSLIGVWCAMFSLIACSGCFLF